MSAKQPAVKDPELGILLACFDGQKRAGKVRGDVAETLRSQGDELLDTSVLEVDDKHKTSLHDRGRGVWGAVAPGISWGLFGLLLGSDGLTSAVIWAVIGVVCGALYGYYSAHHLSKSELTRIGSKLPAASSALFMSVETREASRVLDAASAQQPSVASVALIDDDLNARQIGGVDEPPPGSDVVNMIILRYPDPDAASRVAKKMAAHGKGKQSRYAVELTVRSDKNGHRRVVDPTFGVAGFAPQDVVGWALFGLVFGAIAGATQGGGWLGFVEGGLKTAVVWGLFGVFAGVLFSLLQGRVVSARKLKRVGRLLAPGTSAVVAWSGELTKDALVPFETAESRQLLLRIDAVDHGAVVQARPASSGSEAPVADAPISRATERERVKTNVEPR